MSRNPSAEESCESCRAEESCTAIYAYREALSLLRKETLDLWVYFSVSFVVGIEQRMLLFTYLSGVLGRNQDFKRGGGGFIHEAL